MPPLLCGLPLLGLGAHPLVVPPPPPYALDGTKSTRDAFGDFEHVYETDNFVVKWGDREELDPHEAAALGDAFETAWTEEVDRLGYPAPVGSDVYKFNVYLGDSGSGAPESRGAAGYYTRDTEGQPYIVIAPDTVRRDYFATTAAHEFFHAVQDSTQAYRYDGVDAWFWEATAMWMEGMVYPDHADWYAFLFGYALLPHYPVWYFEAPGSGSLAGYHPYGAALWPRYLTEHAADPSVIHDAWVTHPGATPNAALADALAARGLDIRDSFASFAAHNAVLDYEDGRGMAEVLDRYEAFFGAEATRVVATVQGTTEGLEDPPAETLPEAYGVNLVEWEALPGRWTVTVEGAVTGGDGSRTTWGVTVVVRDGSDIRYVSVPLQRVGMIASGSVEVSIGQDADEAWIVAAALAEDPSGAEARLGERFGWRYAVTEVGVTPYGSDDPDTGADKADGTAAVACGCAAGAPAHPWGAALVGASLVVGLRRRRRGSTGR